MAVPTVVAWSMVTVFVPFVALRVGRVMLDLRCVPSALLALLTSIATVSLLFAVRDYSHPRPTTVTIASPPGGTQVGGIQLPVRGSVQPADATVLLFVRSETDTRWWPQLSSRQVSRDCDVGTWSVDARLGTFEEGKRQNFTLVAIASADGWLFNLLSDRWVDGRARATVPRWSRSDVVVVRRTE